MTGETQRTLGWLGIVRLGLVQTALGAIVVLTTSTFNRVMVVELALAAMVPGFLIAGKDAFQLLRPRWGFGADQGGRRTPWILGGMVVLALGGLGAALSIAWMEHDRGAGLAASVLSFALIGIGLGAAGTNLLALLAREVAPERKPAAASIVWMMMIAGLAGTGIAAGQALDPYSAGRLILVTGVVGLGAVALTALALWGIETRSGARGRVQARPAPEGAPTGPRQSFRAALAEVWADPAARRFTIFVFAAMVAYNTQDLILEPYAGHVFGFTPGQSTALAGMQHSGALMGMIMVAVLATAVGGPVWGSMRLWTVGGCVASGAALGALALGGAASAAWPLELNVAALGFANGVFAVAAIGSMMGLASEGRAGREGTRMGVFGAAQSVGFAIGGFLGTALVDLMRALVSSTAVAYGTVFLVEGLVFLIAALLAVRAIGAVSASSPVSSPAAAPARAAPIAGE